jgi:hypothetical protein
MASEGVARRPDWLGRGIGLAVFTIGVVLLVFVFVQASRLTARVPVQGQKLDQWAIQFGVYIVQLFVCGLVASWIAGRGAQLYAAANRALSEE